MDNKKEFQKIKYSSQFNLYFSKKKPFNFDTSLLKDMGISTDVPPPFRHLNLEKGVYSYGVASTSEKDTDGEKVIISDDVIKNLTEAPYNKIFLSHQNSDIASGVIKFAGRMPEFNNEFMILERINEFHPLFENIAGSIQNGSLDCYSVAGDASVDYDNSGAKIRKVNALREVSRTSYPANPDASINGLFFVKTKEGGYMIKEDNMSEEIIKQLDAIKVEFSKSIADLTARLEGLESFRKTLESSNVQKEMSEEEKKKKMMMEEEEMMDKKVKKSAEAELDEKIEKKLKSMLEPRKAVTKDDSEILQKTKKSQPNVMLDFLRDQNRRSLQ